MLRNCLPGLTIGYLKFEESYLCWPWIESVSLRSKLLLLMKKIAKYSNILCYNLTKNHWLMQFLLFFYKIVAQLVKNLPAIRETCVLQYSRLPWWLRGKVSAYSVGDLGSIPGSGRSSGEGNGNPHSILAWRIPWTEEPGGLQSMGSQRVGYDWATSVYKIGDHYNPKFITDKVESFAC